MSKTNKNNISEYHCLGCQCNSQNKNTAHSPVVDQVDYTVIEAKSIKKDKVRVCVKCWIKEDGSNPMEEFADGTPICVLKLFCEDRCSQLVVNEIKA